MRFQSPMGVKRSFHLPETQKKNINYYNSNVAGYNFTYYICSGYNRRVMRQPEGQYCIYPEFRRSTRFRVDLQKSLLYFEVFVLKSNCA